MADVLESLVVKLALDGSDYNDNLKKAQGGLDTFAGNAAKIGGVMSAAVTAPIVAIGASALDMASDLSESMSKVETVFGANADEIIKWSETSDTALGQSQQQVLEATGTFGNLFSAMGLTSDASLTMSKDIVTLASDLASFNNISPEQALEKLRAGLVGETEPLRTLGVNLTAAAVEAKALSMGITNLVIDEVAVTKAMIDAEQAAQKVADTTNEYGSNSIQAREAANQYTEAMNKLAKAQAGGAEELTAAQKAQAAYALIMEQTTLAHGDFARMSDALANTQRIMQAELANVSAELGQELLPVALEVAQGLRGLLGWFKDLSPETKKWVVIIAAAAAAIGPVLLALAGMASGISAIITVATAATPVIAAIGAGIAAIAAPIAIVIGAVALLAAAWATDFLGIRTKTQEFWSWITGQWPQWMGGLKQGWQGFSDWWQSDTATKVATVKTQWETFYGWLDTKTGGSLTTAQGYWTTFSQGVVSVNQSLWQTVQWGTQIGLDATKGVLTAAVQFMQGDWQGGLQTLQTTAEGIWQSIYTQFQTQIDAITGLFTGTNWAQVGTDIIAGIARGIDAGLDSIERAARDAADAALRAAKSFLGINSPAKVPGKELGVPFAQGTAKGVVDGIPAASNTIQDALNAMVGSLEMPTLAASTGGGGTIVNITIYAGDRDTANQARLGLLDALRQVGLA